MSRPRMKSAGSDYRITVGMSRAYCGQASRVTVALRTPPLLVS